MEERIIDDEYARGIRLKKTKDGYVDVTEETAEGETDGEQLSDEEEVEEVTFQFPVLEEDDEELVNLTPEEAVALRKRREEEAAARKEEYKRLCAEGEELLGLSSFHAAELKFEKALNLEEDADEAVAGYWRAKTSEFAHPEVLLDEYLETGSQSMENDLGESAIERLKAGYKDVFAERLKELTEEETPLAREVEEKQASRRSILKKRLAGACKKFVATLVPTFVLLVLTIVFALRITTRRDGLFVGLTIGAGALFGICFILFGVFTNKFINTLRINRANEDLSSTEDGEKLLKLRAYIELYGYLAK